MASEMLEFEDDDEPNETSMVGSKRSHPNDRSSTITNDKREMQSAS
jgi:hypothetical protein